MNIAREKKILSMLRDCSLDKARLHERKREYKIAYLHFKNYHHYAMKIEKEKSIQQMASVLQVEESDSPKDIHEPIQILNIIGRTEKFRTNLLIDFPELTPRQLEIAGLLKNGMSSKEISVMLNIEVESINRQRTRIRKTMNLNRNINLTTSLQKL